jgi:hypothetical protein
MQPASGRTADGGTELHSALADWLSQDGALPPLAPGRCSEPEGEAHLPSGWWILPMLTLAVPAWAGLLWLLSPA